MGSLLVDADSKFIFNALHASYLEADEEYQYLINWKDNKSPDALEKIITSHIRMVIATAKKFRHYGLPLSDLIQEGNLGLMLALEKFEIDRELRFSTYAIWWIKACMQDYILKNWSMVKFGTTAVHKSLFFNYKKLMRRLDVDEANIEERQDIIQELAKKMNITNDKINIFTMRLQANDQSLNSKVGDDTQSTEFQDNLVDERQDIEKNVLDKIEVEQRKEWLYSALTKLTEREQFVLNGRYGEEILQATLEKLGTDLGLSKERVRQIEKQAVDKLKKILTESKLFFSIN
jgi:RNA polymerase sigma-32 factor